MTTLIIFGAKYLALLSPLIVLWLGVTKFRNEWQKFITILVANLGLSYLFGLLARGVYYDPRPFVVESFTPLVAHLSDNGFLSDHTLLLASLATSVGFFDKKFAALLWLITILVGTARVLAGVHHTIDILGSIVIALIVKWLVYFVLEQRKKV